jgi:hypothetical protein
MSLDQHSLKTIVHAWPVLTTGAGFIAFILGVLAVNGYIDPAMHRSDMAVINRHVTEIEETLNDNKIEHRSMQTDIRTIMGSLGRIEGQLGGHGK